MKSRSWKPNSCWRALVYLHPCAHSCETLGGLKTLLQEDECWFLWPSKQLLVAQWQLSCVIHSVAQNESLLCAISLAGPKTVLLHAHGRF